MMPDHSIRTRWIGVFACAIIFQFAPLSFAQPSKWDPEVSKDWFKDDQTPPDPKNTKKPQKPTHRLAKTDCDDCQKIVDDLQKALDDWYALELAEANDTIKKSMQGQDTEISQTDARAQKEDAMAGLGQKERAPPKGKSKADVKKEIKKLSDKLTECLKKCAGTPTPAPTPTPIPGPNDDTGKNKIPNPPAFDVQIPSLPPCFDSEGDRQKYREKLEELQKKLTGIKKSNGPELAEPPNDAWKEFKEKLEKAFKDLSDQITRGANGKDKVDGVPVPCKTGTGGGGKAPTPTPAKGKPKRAPRVATGGNISLPTETFCALISENKIKIDITGTGETIGHIAEVRISNQTDDPIEVTIPPVVLESRSGKNQNYGVPHPTDVALKPHEAKTIPLDGVCLDRHKPPVGKGIGDDLAFVDCDPDPRINQDDSHRMLRIAESVYEAADKLEDDGKLKEMPYKDPKKRKEIVEQWATWIRVSEVTGDPPPTKEDLRKVVEKQVGKVPPDKQKKIDEGIDTIFDKIELTTEKAKDYDKPEDETTEGSEDEYTPPNQPEYVGQGHTYAKQPTPTPTPKKKGGGGTKEKPTPTPTPTPKEKGPGTKEKPTPKPTPSPTPTPTPEPDPPDKYTPPSVKYPQTFKTPCGDISISINENGEIIFDFTPNGKCPCKKFGWIQHFRSYPGDPDHPNWHYDNGTLPSVTTPTGGQGAISHPDKPTQPTKPPKGTNEDEWTDGNPWYGGRPKDNPDKDFAKHPKPQQKIGDKPNHPATTYRTQLVCVDTGEVLFTWAWGPFEDGTEKPDTTGGGQIPPPPLKK